MNRFEDELKRALTRRQPSEDFTARVLAAARYEAEQNRPRWHAWLRVKRGPFWAFAPLTAMLLLFSGDAAYQHHTRIVKGLHAKHQLLLAMRIAGKELQQARLHVQKISTQEIVAQ
jgi:MprA protease rhombosortase-interaction domain-containing protein